MKILNFVKNSQYKDKKENSFVRLHQRKSIRKKKVNKIIIYPLMKVCEIHYALQLKVNTDYQLDATSVSKYLHQHEHLIQEISFVLYPREKHFHHNYTKK